MKAGDLQGDYAMRSPDNAKFQKKKNKDKTKKKEARTDPALDMPDREDNL